MTQEDDDFIAVDLENGERLRFNSAEVLASWIDEEQEYWAWTRSVTEKPFAVTADAVNGWREKLSDAKGALSTAQNPSLSSEDRSSAHQRLSYAIRDYAQEDFASVSPRAAFVSRLRETHGAPFAFAALNHALGGAHKAGTTQVRKLLRRAYCAIDAFDARLDVAFPNAVGASIKKMMRHHQSLVRGEISKTNTALTSLLEASRKVEGDVAQFTDDVGSQINEQRERLQRDADAAVERLETTRKAYQERMHLGASVEYWNNKAVKHEDNAKRLKKTVIWFATIAGVVLAVVLAFLGLVGLIVAVQKDASPTAPLLLLGIGVVATTGVMWAGRVLVRLFLSEHHLGIDARERATMALTFLALTNEGKIEPSERALVLAPMFRPTTDGIVKDDGAPDATIAGHLSRITGR